MEERPGGRRAKGETGRNGVETWGKGRDREEGGRDRDE
jgi:hypothetical protein